MTQPAVFLDVACTPLAPEGGRDRFGADVVSFGAPRGQKGPGARRVTLERGRRALASGGRLANEETRVTRGAEGTYRPGDAGHPVKAGDVRVAPKVGRETARRMIRTGSKPLKYKGILTSNDPDIVECPDSGKFAPMEIWPGAAFSGAHPEVVVRVGESLDYWDGGDV